MLAGFERDEIVREMELAPRRALASLPDTQVIERDGFWQVITPSLTKGGRNAVVCSALPEEGDADTLIDEALAPYLELGLRFRWTIYPVAEPDDLGERLLARGLIPVAGLGMARATDGLLASGDAAISVEEVTLENVDAFTQVTAAGWGQEAAPLNVFHRLTLADPTERHRNFLARCHGAPAASATYLALERSAHLIGGVTLPEFRGRGLYRALVQARLADANARGLRLATTVAQLDTSAPVLARLGFQRVCSIVSYVNW